jgi:hypothetical protein
MPLFTPATREKTFLKACFAGPAGSGKSFTSLRLAHAMQAVGLGKRIAVIESEAGKIKKYAGYVVDDRKWAFDAAVLTSFGPQEYIAAIEEAVRAGYDLIVIDSLSHEWQGAGGALEMVDRLSERNKFTAWKDVTPLHTRFIESILRAPAHVIATVRLKMGYVLVEETKDGKTSKVPRKVGMEPIQRNGLEYEFEIFCSLDESHILRVEKTICPTIDGKTCIEPGEAFFRPVFDWLSTGEEVRTERYESFTVPPEELVAVVGELGAARCSLDVEKEWILQNFGVRELGHLSRSQFAKWKTVRVPMVIAAANRGLPTAAPVAVAPTSPTPATVSQQPSTIAPVSQPSPATAPNGSAGRTPSLSGEPKTDCIQLWEELCNLKQWSRPDVEKNFKLAILDPLKVAHARDIRTDQWIELRERMTNVVRKLYEERGLAGASPFHGPESTIAGNGNGAASSSNAGNATLAGAK